MPLRYSDELDSTPTALQPRWGSGPPGFAINNLSSVRIWKKALLCNPLMNLVQTNGYLWGPTHPNDWEITELEIP